MEHGDQTRRLREDLLFASVNEETRLGAKLDDPDTLYTKVQERAAVVHSALQLRDRVLADFPYYSRWLAGLSLKALPDNEEKRWLETWDNIHELCRLLDASNRDLEALKVQANKIHFDELAQRFAEEYAVKNTSVTPKNWRRLQDLLSVPLIPADYRRERLAELATISRELNIGTKKAAELTAADDAISTTATRRRRLSFKAASHYTYWEVRIPPPRKSTRSSPGPRATGRTHWCAPASNSATPSMPRSARCMRTPTRAGPLPWTKQHRCSETRR